MAIGVGVNAILDPLLIAGPGPFPRWGLAGAAIASIISAAVAFVTGAFYLNSRNSMVAFTPRRLAFHGATAKLIFKIGLPSMVQQSLISLGMAAVTFLVTRFGEPALAAFGAAGRCDSIAFMPAMSMGMAVSTIAGQNLGAGRLDRVHESFKWGIYMTTAMSGFMAIVFLSVPSQLMSMFVNDPAVIRIGSMYLRIIGPSLMAFAVLFVSNGVINGAGRTMITMIFSLVSLWGFRVPLAWFLSRTSLGTTGIWIGMASSFVLMMFVSLAYYRSGKWQKNIVIPNKMEELTTPLVAAEV
jgi:putative MATE family efflux protein